MTSREAIAWAMRTCDLDCSLWDDDVLKEAANVIVNGLNKEGYVIIRDRIDPEGGIPGRR